MGDIEKEEAMFMANGGEKTRAGAITKWEATESGQREIKLKRESDSFLDENPFLISPMKDQNNLTEKERIDLIKQANDIEVQAFNERQKRNVIEINNEARKFNILAKLNEADLKATLLGTAEQQKAFREKLKSQNRFDEESFNKTQELLLERVSIERESIAVQEKLTNRRNQLEQQITDEKQKEIDKQNIAEEKRKAANNRVSSDKLIFSINTFFNFDF